MDITITLPAELARAVETRVQSGDYASVSEMVGVALELLDATGSKDSEALPALRSAWEAGVASGDAGPIDFVELRAAAQSRLASLPVSKTVR